MAAKGKRPQQEKLKKKEITKKAASPAKIRSKSSIKPAVDEISPVKPAGKNFPIIGMGASAGGLDAFEKFFKNMSQDSGAAFILISHLSPDQKSLMPEILQKHTKMDIYQIEDGMTVRPNRIYVIPPNKDAIVKDGTLRLIEPYISKGIRHPIDVFFRSLADDQGEKAICVILSGTGTEGTLGLKAIKAEGGIVIVQKPESAGYDGMPDSAIATGLVDYIAPPEEMPGQILDYIQRSFRRARVPVEKEIVPDDNLYTVLALIREHTGHDFSDYKMNTIKRRIEKRMVIHNIEDIRNYVRYLQENPNERVALFKEFLISVTRFFRDPEAFAFLKEKIFPDLCKNRTGTSAIRVWVVGCATGEEAYSIAMIFKEYIEENSLDCTAQIFATDIDGDAVENARAGIFPEGIAVDVSQERLKKYFTRKKNLYVIKKPLREMIVFSMQNVVKDPPFSKIDLICCRNLLIYVNAKLQKRIFSTFHYALNREGVLFLGTSETIGEFSNLFSAVEKKWKFYKRLGEEGHIPRRDFDLAIAIRERVPQRAIEYEEKGKMLLPGAVQHMLLDSYAPTCIVVDEKMQVRYFHGKTGRYLEPSEGEASFSVMNMFKDGLRNRLYMAIQDARQKKQDAYHKAVHVKMNGDYASVTLSVRLLSQRHMEGWAVVLFEEEKTPEPEVSARKRPYTQKEAKDIVAQLQNELRHAKQSHQMTTEELETANEELQSTNEELQSSNEELQSTNEELETSREELQSLNEELATVNTELQEKIQEQGGAAEDMQGLLSNMDVPTIFLDGDLNLIRFTPQATQVTNLLDRDIGRSFQDIRKSILDLDVDLEIRDVQKSMVPKKLEVFSEDGVPYLLRIIPYRGAGEGTVGVVLTFMDTTEVKQASECSENIIDSVHESLVVLDKNLCVVNANRPFYETFQIRPEDSEKKPIYELGNGRWDIPALKELLEKILPQKTWVEDYVVEHDFPDIGRRKMLLNARQISCGGPGKQMTLLAIEEITEKKGI